MGAGRDTEHFQRLLKPHLPRLHRLACHLATTRADADDLFQDVLARCFARLDELEGLDDPSSWLARVMVNRFLDDRRRHARERRRFVQEAGLPQHSIDTLAATGDNLRDAVFEEQLHIAGHALDTLPEEQRLVLLMHDVEGYKLDEIRDITETPLGTVKSRLHRARARLRKLLADSGTF